MPAPHRALRRARCRRHTTACSASPSTTRTTPHAPPLGADAVDAIGWYALAVTEVDSLELSETFCRLLERNDDTIMSTPDRTCQKGKDVGKAERRAEALLRQITRRFGAPTDAVSARVRGASLAELDRLRDRILDAATLADLFGA